MKFASRKLESVHVRVVLRGSYPQGHPPGYDDHRKESGGANRDRTGDLYNAIVALSQLSYSPTLLETGSAYST